MNNKGFGLVEIILSVVIIAGVFILLRPMF